MPGKKKQKQKKTIGTQCMIYDVLIIVASNTTRSSPAPQKKNKTDNILCFTNTQLQRKHFSGKTKVRSAQKVENFLYYCPFF